MQNPKRAQELLPATEECVDLNTTFRGKYRGFALFLICCALLIAALAVSSVWLQGNGFGWLDTPFDVIDTSESDGTQGTDTEKDENIQPSPDAVPEHAMPIVQKDLSYPSLGENYIHNETAYAPNVQELLDGFLPPDLGESPTVLILHTHTSEGYLPPDTAYVTEPIGALTYTRDSESNVIAVGKALADALQKKGITAIHCTVMHDASGLSGAYERSAQTVKKYLEEYPEIDLVIDLHRDAVISAEGEAVKAVTELDGKRVAQVMAVVGSDGNGTEHAGWENNLSLALQLRRALNQRGHLCRPVSLRNASFYQELAPLSLLLEIGTSAGSVDEATAAAVIVGEVLAELLYC